MGGRPWTWPVVVLAVVAVVAAGCGGDDDSSDTTTTTEAPTTTTEGATTTTAPTTTTTLPDEPPLREDGVSGSGCSPGSGPLPDGWWYGTVDAAIEDEVAFDLACYYIGAAAEAEAAKRGDEVDNDYYVVNENPQVRTVTLADGATATCVQLGAGVESVDCTPADVGGDWAVWLRVQGGEVDRIVEQYAP